MSTEIIGFVAKPRQGKTLMMIMWAYRYKRKGWNVLSYRLKTTFSELITINDILNFDIKPHSVLLLDEVHTLIDSRSVSAVNRLSSYFWTQHGKRDIKIMYTTQLNGMVDLRLRDIADKVIGCKKIFVKNKFTRKRRLVGFTYGRKIDDDTVIYTKRLPIRRAKKYFSMYDTTQIIQPLEVDASDSLTMIEVKRIIKMAPNKKSFISSLRNGHEWITYDNAGAVYDYGKSDNWQEVKNLLKIK